MTQRQADFHRTEENSIGPFCPPDAHGHCITCGDTALPARVLQVTETGWTALVAVNGQTAEVDIILVDGVTAGQVLLVHGGVALERMDTGD